MEYSSHNGYISSVVEDSEMVSVRTKAAGIFESAVHVGEEIVQGQLMARIIDPLEGEVKAELYAPCDGIVFFRHSNPMTYTNTAVFKLIAGNR